MTFTGYPLSADWEGDDANLNQQAPAHNRVEVAANELQDQITTLQGQMDGFDSLATTMTAFMNLFSAPVMITPTLVNVTVGAAPGASWMRYIRVGQLVLIEGGFRLGSGFTMHATAPMGFQLPFNAAYIATGGVERRPVISCYANNYSASQRTSGAGIVAVTEPQWLRRFANEATGLGWDAGSPFTWAINDDMQFSGHYWCVP